MLRYSNYVTYQERFETAARSFLGGDVIAILLRQGMRLKALKRQAEFELRRGQLASSIEPISNPTTFLADIPITVKKQESFNYQADATRFPVETGSIISDHVILHPLRIDISFEISNWESGTAEYALELLETLWALRLPVDLMTHHRKMANMVLVTLQTNNSVPEWGKIDARATFQQIGQGVLQFDTYSKDRFKQTGRTGGPDTVQSSSPAESPTTTQPKESLASKGLKGLFGR